MNYKTIFRVERESKLDLSIIAETFKCGQIAGPSWSSEQTSDQLWGCLETAGSSWVNEEATGPSLASDIAIEIISMVSKYNE